MALKEICWDSNFYFEYLSNPILFFSKESIKCQVGKKNKNPSHSFLLDWPEAIMCQIQSKLLLASKGTVIEGVPSQVRCKHDNPPHLTYSCLVQNKLVYLGRGLERWAQGLLKKLGSLYIFVKCVFIFLYIHTYNTLYVLYLLICVWGQHVKKINKVLSSDRREIK